jgi:hypothetical protein
VYGTSAGPDQLIFSFQVFQVIADGNLTHVKFLTQIRNQHFTGFLDTFQNLFPAGNGKSFLSDSHSYFIDLKDILSMAPVA